MLSNVKVKVSGKINLSLNITGIKDGLHTLDSVVTSISLCDTVFVRKRMDEKINFEFNAPFVPEHNTVIKAVDALRSIVGNFGADIIVDKNLPLAGGMGGSSADAAGVLVALASLYDFGEINYNAIASSVGSDVSYMMKGGYARLRGIGDEVSYFDCDRRMGLVYVCDEGALTSKVYAQFDRLGGDGKVDNDLLISSLVGGKDFLMGNMLYRAATSLRPSIERNANALASIGLSPNMTGSGSSVYAFSSDPHRDVARLTERGVYANVAFTQPGGIEFL